MMFNGRANFTQQELDSQFTRLAVGQEFAAFRSYLLNKRELIIEKLTLDKAVIVSQELKSTYIGRLGVVDELLNDIFQKYVGPVIPPEDMYGLAEVVEAKPELRKRAKKVKSKNDDAAVGNLAVE